MKSVDEDGDRRLGFSTAATLLIFLIWIAFNIALGRHCWRCPQRCTAS